MKKFAVAAALLCAFVTSSASADETADPNDPCAMVLCLAGKLGGGNPAECDPVYKSFISINAKKHGSFSASRTSDARKNKLSQCPGVDPQIIGDIISKFGRLKRW